MYLLESILRSKRILFKKTAAMSDYAGTIVQVISDITTCCE